METNQIMFLLISDVYIRFIEERSTANTKEINCCNFPSRSTMNARSFRKAKSNVLYGANKFSCDLSEMVRILIILQ